MEIAMDITIDDIPRTPNPRGRPRYLLSRVRIYGFAINQSRMKHIHAEMISIASRISSYIMLTYSACFICFFILVIN
jgi:hypothetical protein